MKQRFQSMLVITLVVIGIVLAFQNCSDPLGSTDQASYTANLPFAYDTTLDTIAYMSCAGGDTAANTEAIWTFRAGAFGANSGIRLKDDYLSLTRNYSSSQRAAALAESTLNAKASLTLAVRPASTLQSILTSSGSSGELGEDYANLLGPLDSSEIATQLAQIDPTNPTRRNYFPGTNGGRSLGGRIRFTKDEGEANSVRGYLSGSALLTATYTPDAMPNYYARGPAGVVDTSAYGRGYKLQFNYFSGETVARVLSSVQELDLTTGRSSSDAASWSCPAELQFRIARSCSECACSNDAGNPVTLAQVRRALKVEHWYVSLDSRCVVQKSLSQQCYPTSSTGNYHFVSICTRN